MGRSDADRWCQTAGWAWELTSLPSQNSLPRGCSWSWRPSLWGHLSISYPSSSHSFWYQRGSKLILSWNVLPENCISSVRPSVAATSPLMSRLESSQIIEFQTARERLPRGPVGKNPSSQCRGPGFDPWSGSQMPHALTKSPHAAIKDPTHHNKDRRCPACHNWDLA